MNKFVDQPRVSSLPQSDKIFELLGIGRELDSKIRIIDSIESDDLYLIHFIDNDAQVQHIKGIIIATQPEPKIVCNSFPQTREIKYSIWENNSTEIRKVKESLNFDKSEITEAEEGTIIRIFYKEKYIRRSRNGETKLYSEIAKIPPKEQATEKEEISEEQIKENSWNSIIEEDEKETKENKENSSEGGSAETENENDEVKENEDEEKSGGTWYISTHKKINGKDHRWVGPSFSEILEDAWPNCFESGFETWLDKDKCYVFLISHPQSRLVCNVEKPFIKLTALFETKGNILIRKNIIQEYKGRLDKNKIPFYPPKFLDIKSIKKLNERCSNVDWKKFTGILIYNTETNKCIKVVPDDYIIRRNIRGNIPQIAARWIQLYFKEESQRQIETLYPQEAKVFKNTHTNLLSLIRVLVNIYTRRYSKNEYITLPRAMHTVLKNVNESFNSEISIVDQIKFALSRTKAQDVLFMAQNHLDMEQYISKTRSYKKDGDDGEGEYISKTRSYKKNGDDDEEYDEEDGECEDSDEEP
jgi:hypothetical protein